MRFAAGVEYDGTAYHGWQAQGPGVRTIQSSVEHALSFVANHPVRVICAGRTDTAVHARGQVVHFDTESQRTLRSWVLGANVNLPVDIALTWVSHVDESFHARFSARSRRYRYEILNRWVRPAILHGKVTWHHPPLDEERMRGAAAHLKGKHDFSTFRALQCQAKSPVRHVTEISVSRNADFVSIEVEADGFLHHMVRNIAGVLMTIGRGERPPEWIQELLELRDRTRGGVTAPPDGLYFIRASYDPVFGLPEPVGSPPVLL
ncbi:MAG: tRNA pseudouridine(38-40) synthase TruA [Pseudomonadota bacterium]|nr:tRNA pseudouridine(38-40) synthase TruA [Pseudomonadota bacterium]